MMNLTGPPGIAAKVGRKATWVATREITLVPGRDEGFLFSSEGLLVVIWANWVAPWDVFPAPSIYIGAGFSILILYEVI